MDAIKSILGDSRPRGLPQLMLAPDGEDESTNLVGPCFGLHALEALLFQGIPFACFSCDCCTLSAIHGDRAAQKILSSG